MNLKPALDSTRRSLVLAAVVEVAFGVGLVALLVLDDDTTELGIR